MLSDESKIARIIPAYAGQIYHDCSQEVHERDHPRIRGTNVFPSNPRKIPLGSSPHTRDKYDEIVFAEKNHGIIPAYAGQISSLSVSRMFFRDHPRIRGTNLSFGLRGFFNIGSSPHTRDKFRYIVIHNAAIGIIPAYAGQILILKKNQSVQKDHPRIRGTN